MASGYTIYYSDPAKNTNPIFIADGTENSRSTSLTLIGRNYPGYGQALAQDLVQLLENFSSSTPPTNPIEGQLWFDTSDPTNKKLRINDGIASGALWKPINGLYQQPNQPTNVSLGDIWVDTSQNQLSFYNGSSFTLVGPNYSSATKTGSYPVTLTDISNGTHEVVINYVDDVPVEIITRDSFIPNPVIPGFSNGLVSGVNLSTSNLGSLQSPIYPAINATANAAQNIQLNNGTKVISDFLLRNDIPQTTKSLTISDNNSLQIGITNSLNVSIVSQRIANFVNNINNGQFNFTVAGVNKPLMIMDGSTQLITVNDPSSVSSTAGLAVNGSIWASSSATVSTLFITSTASNIAGVSNNALQIAGGVGIGSTLVVTGEHILEGPLTVGPSPITAPRSPSTSIVVPSQDSVFDIGDPVVRWRNVYANVFQSSTSSGSTATFIGIATNATQFASPSLVTVTGEFQTTTGSNFVGAGIPLTLNVRASTGLITNRSAVSITTGSDTLIMYSSSSTLLVKQTKRDFLSDVNYQDPIAPTYNANLSTPAGSLVPLGTIILYSGTGTNLPPSGWLVCNGQALTTDPKYQNLKNLIGHTYSSTTSTWNVPNLTGPVSSSPNVTINYIIKY